MHDTKYALSTDIHIAYQVVGSGSVDLFFVPGWFTHVELGWEFPPYARFLERLASFSRLIVMDKRGTGASDRAVPSLALEDQLDDLRAVLDAAESEREFFFGTMEGGGLSLLFAAMYPERVLGVVTYETLARMMRADDYPWGTTREEQEFMIENVMRGWSDTEFNRKLAREYNPGMGNTELDWAIRWSRAAASPGTAKALMRMYMSIDIRAVLPSVKAPVLVVNQLGSRIVGPDHGRYLAEHLPNARFVGIPGASFFPGGALEQLAEEIEEFVTGTRGHLDADRVFATILYTDFVGSTRQTAEIGDRPWRDLLDRHDDIARRQLERFRGALVKHTGDGIVATFDGPGRAIRCAAAIRDAVDGLGLTLRIGVHAGEVEQRGEELAGIAMSIGVRVMELAGPGEILVSNTVKDLVVGSGLEFDDRGSHELKGVPGSWRLYAVKA